MTGATGTRPLRSARATLAGLARSQQRQYAGDADRPLAGYLGTMATYGTVVGALAAATRLSGRPVPDGLPVKDVTLCALATHKLSRLLTKDPVTSPLRAPFTAYQGTSGPAELAEEVRGSGARKTVGELVTCPFCVGLWVATGFTAGLIWLPRTTRLASGTLAALTGADMLHYAYAWLEQQAS
jgi:hypothetical protein